MPPLVIRADAGGTLGTGHVMRMLALAQAWQRRGGKVILATACCPDPLVNRIEAAGFRHEAISCKNPGDEQDAAATLALSSDWLVLDGYHFREDYQKTCREAGRRLLCVDDFGHCSEWHCNLYLNQNPGAPALPGPAPEQLRDLSFALLREEFLDHARDTAPWAPLKKILVTLGGSDPPNATAWVLQQLARENHHDLKVRAIIGPANPHRDDLRALDLPLDLEWREAVTDMPAQYAWADGVISAGGSSCWEWLYFGRPGAVVTIADNQEPIVAELTRRRVALGLGWPDDGKDLGLSEWLADPAATLDQAATADLVDGRGADRVASVLDGTHCLIRRLDPGRDDRFTFELANHPTVRSVGYANDPIPWQTHLDWLHRHHRSPDSFLFIIEDPSSGKVGSLRFQREEDENEWEISIALTPESRGRGYARNAITLGQSELASRHGIRQFRATIRPTNTPSRKLFESLGFRHLGTEGQRETWIHHLP